MTSPAPSNLPITTGKGMKLEDIQCAKLMLDEYDAARRLKMHYKSVATWCEAIGKPVATEARMRKVLLLAGESDQWPPHLRRMCFHPKERHYIVGMHVLSLTELKAQQAEDRKREKRERIRFAAASLTNPAEHDLIVAHQAETMQTTAQLNNFHKVLNGIKDPVEKARIEKRVADDIRRLGLVPQQGLSFPALWRREKQK